MSKIKKTDNCWEWTAGKDSARYGQFRLNGKMHGAHRISYELLKGDIPDGLELDHLCRNRACVNPDHLEAVTHKENMERGVWPQSTNKECKKTHCPRDHLYSGRNSQGKRVCRICDTKRNKLTMRRIRKAKKIA